METNELAQRVWERVAGSSGEMLHCPSLIDREEEAAAVFHHLAAHSTAHRGKYHALEQQSRENADVLRGIHLLSGGEGYRHPTYTPQKEKPSHLLAHACRDCRLLQERYAALSHSGEYACVFHQLAQQKAAALTTLLALLAG